MARIRTIKPSFWGDDRVCHLSRDARLLMLGLISMADDQGRFIATPQAILGYLFPLDRISHAQLNRWLAQVEAEHMVCIYHNNGGTYGQLLGFTRHQRISHPQDSPLPAPPQEGLFP